jgi:GTP cyclohydrolase I
MPIDRERAARAVEELLRALGQDVASPDLEGTGARVAEAWERDLLAGESIDVPALLLAESFASDGAQSTDVVVLRDVTVTTMCPHHLLPAMGTATIAYAPGARVTGLGTLVRVVDALSRRLTLQERIGHGVVDALMTNLGARGALCFQRLKHSCLVARGERRDAWVETIASAGTLSAGGSQAAWAASITTGSR